jgi:triosephosphate isomerase
MKKVIIANLKMNLIKEECEQYLQTIKGKITDELEVIICPSFPFLSIFISKEFKLGAQNTFYLEKGSYTGEVSSIQLKSIGVKYIIVGHSERRKYLNENNDLINKKIIAVLKQNINPILCIGETEEEKAMHKTAVVIKKQLDEALKNVEPEDLNDIVIAYEPVWAIGSGITPTLDEINDSISFIKNIILQKYNFDHIKVLYGGSVNLDNIKQIMNLSYVDGVLIGSASTDPNTFIKMLSIIE